MDVCNMLHHIQNGDDLQKKDGTRKTGIAYRRKMKIKHREQIRKNTSYGYELLGKRKWRIQMSNDSWKDSVKDK